MVRRILVVAEEKDLPRNAFWWNQNYCG